MLYQLCLPMKFTFPLLFVALVLISPSVGVADGKLFKREKEIIYGRKHGLAMTLDVFQPLGKRNNRGIVFVISGGWFSTNHKIDEAFKVLNCTELINLGYTLFAVVHGSQPKFTVPEIRQDMHRAVRFIRHNAKTYGIDSEQIGILGGSAGGHLSLMQGTSGLDGDPDVSDPVERQSSRVQAVVAYFPPTDFLNYGGEGEPTITSATCPTAIIRSWPRWISTPTTAGKIGTSESRAMPKCGIDSVRLLPRPMSPRGMRPR